jgi:hypothetical protein
MMRKYLWLIGAVAAAALTFGASIALGAVTVKSLPTASFSGASVTVSGGNFSGLGNTPAIANLTVTGVATYTCRNPKGHASPGQNPVAAQSGSSGPFNLGNSDHNGRGTISSITASVSAPDTPTATEAGCGGSGSTQWTVTLDALTATAAQLVITEGSTVVFCRNYTSNGTGTAC